MIPRFGEHDLYPNYPKGRGKHSTSTVLGGPVPSSPHSFVQTPSPDVPQYSFGPQHPINIACAANSITGKSEYLSMRYFQRQGPKQYEPAISILAIWKEPLSTFNRQCRCRRWSPFWTLKRTTPSRRIVRLTQQPAGIPRGVIENSRPVGARPGPAIWGAPASGGYGCG